MNIRDRIIDFRRVRASELRPNPRNWRTHPQAQREALQGVLAEVGYVDAVLARTLPDGSLELLDGHLRAETTPDMDVPCLVVDLNDAEAAKVLATFDPLSAMAESSSAKLDELLREIDTGSEALQQMLAKLAEDEGMYDVSDCEPPELADGDREPFRQMTFTVHDSQFDVIEVAISKAKSEGGGESEVNENSNGNALAFICEAFNG